MKSFAGWQSADSDLPGSLFLRGRFLMEAVSRKPDIADDLFRRAEQPFKRLLPKIRGRSDERNHYLAALKDAESLLKQASPEMQDDLVKAITEWAIEWRLNAAPFPLFGLAVLVVGLVRMPLRLGSDSERHIYFWQQVAEGMCRRAEEINLEKIVQAGTLPAPPRGFPVYRGQPRAEYIRLAVEALQPHVDALAAVVPSADRKTLLRKVQRKAETYCRKAEGAMQAADYRRSQNTPNLQRDLTWTIARRIEDISWEKIASRAEVTEKIVKAAVGRTLDRLGLPRPPSFEPAPQKKS